MRRRVWGGLAKIWLLAIIMVLALGAVGVTYGKWMDTISVNGTMNMTTVETTLSCAGSQSDDVRCNSSGMTLDINVNGPIADGDYYCDFVVGNTGDIPVKIQGISVSSLPVGVHVNTTDVIVGSQIEPVLAKSGAVNITIDGSATNLPASFSFNVTFIIVPWNQYVP
jgi:hypothetical protein